MYCLTLHVFVDPTGSLHHSRVPNVRPHRVLKPTPLLIHTQTCPQNVLSYKVDYSVDSTASQAEELNITRVAVSKAYILKTRIDNRTLPAINDAVLVLNNFSLFALLNLSTVCMARDLNVEVRFQNPEVSEDCCEVFKGTTGINNRNTHVNFSLVLFLRPSPVR